MKMLGVLIVVLSTSCVPATASTGINTIPCSDKVLMSSGKAYKYTEVEGECLLSNEWSPVDSSGYTDEYKATKEYQVAKHANDYIRNNRRDK